MNKFVKNEHYMNKHMNKHMNKWTYIWTNIWTNNNVFTSYSMASDQLCGSMLFKSCAAVFFAQRICAMPRFLAVLRVPARILGNAMFSNGFWRASVCIVRRSNHESTNGNVSPKPFILLQAVRERRMSPQSTVFDDFPITIRFPGLPPGCLWRALFHIRAGHWKCKEFQWF